MTQTKDVVVKRDYKSTMFKMIFEEKERLMELYNAVSGRNYDDPELLTINTLENAFGRIFCGGFYRNIRRRREQ